MLVEIYTHAELKTFVGRTITKLLVTSYNFLKIIIFVALELCEHFPIFRNWCFRLNRHNVIITDAVLKHTTCE